MVKPPQLGEQEWEVLRFVADRAPVSVRDVAHEWGEPRGLARTTILTVMERLRKKEFLTRTKDDGDGSFLYAPAASKATMMQNMVQEFVERTLGGSLSPFMAYLADSKGLSEQEKTELRRIVERMEADAE